MNRYLTMIAAGAVAVSGCTHNVNVTKRTIGGPAYSSISERQTIADETCESHYQPKRQNYLSAAQSAIAAGQALPDASDAPLDAFRAEVNAAYDTVVMRCKTHMHCLEVQGYNEAACYMAASDRKDAERRFADLSERLREIERDADAKIAQAKKRGPSIKLTQNNKQSQSNDQSQTTDTHVGDDIADQDVLLLCGSVKGLLKRPCRQPCGANACGN